MDPALTGDAACLVASILVGMSLWLTAHRHGSRPGRKGSDKLDVKQPECLRAFIPKDFFHKTPSSNWAATNTLLILLKGVTVMSGVRLITSANFFTLKTPNSESIN